LGPHRPREGTSGRASRRSYRQDEEKSSIATILWACLTQRIGSRTRGETVAERDSNPLHNNNVVAIALRDWGRVIQRSVFDLYILEDRFRERNWGAIPCGLNRIQPIAGRVRWPRRARELTRLLLEKREGWMEILQPVRKDAATISLELKCGSDEEMNNPRELLIRMGCAERAEEITKFAIPSVMQEIVN
jgi:hypothetical protein